MGVDLKKFERLKEQKERDQRAADKAEGAMEQLLPKLKKDFGVKSLKEAEELLEKLEGEGKDLAEKYNKELEKIEEEYGDKL